MSKCPTCGHISINLDDRQKAATIISKLCAYYDRESVAAQLGIIKTYVSTAENLTKTPFGTFACPPSAITKILAWGDRQ